MDRQQPERVPCPRCGFFFIRGAGIASHLRGRRCLGRQMLPPGVAEVAPRAAILPRQVAPPALPDIVPNLLYMTAMRRNQPRQDDDDLSVIEGELEDFDVPGDVLNNGLQREDGRLPRVIEFVQDLVNRRAPLPPLTYEAMIWNTVEISYTIGDLLLKCGVLFVLVCAIFLFHNDQDEVYSNDFADLNNLFEYCEI